MATLNVSLPADLKDEFLREFADENRSAIIGELIREAIAARKLQRQRLAAVNEILALRANAPVVSDEEIHRLRGEGRP